MKKNVSVSAPGKFHLIGEYSAVFGKPAILCAIDRRVVVNLSTSEKDSFFNDDKIAQNATKAIRDYIVKKYNQKKVPVSIEIKSSLPIGKGLGSSAAISAAIAGALFGLYDLKFDHDDIYEAAFVGERVFHGFPSGGDLAACVYGGAIWFRKETDELKLFKKLNVTNKIFKNFLLVDTGKPTESTKEMVEIFLQKLKTQKTMVMDFASSQELLTKNLLEALNKNDNKEILKIIKEAEINLEKLGIAGKKAKQIIRTLENNDTSIKISGAGGIKDGSGMLLVYTNDRTKILKYCMEKNLEYLEINLDTEGVNIHE